MSSVKVHEQEVQQAQETLAIVREISNELNTGLDEECLRLVLALCEHGVQPEALSDAIIRNSQRSAVEPSVEPPQKKSKKK